MADNASTEGNSSLTMKEHPREHSLINIDTESPLFAKAPDSTHKPTRGRVLRASIWIALLLIFAFAFYLVWGHKEDAKPGGRRGFSGPVTLATATAGKGNIGVYLDAIGTVTPVYTASIVSQTTGVVVAVKYQEGQIVNKGDPLTDIDDRQYQATLLQAQGTLDRDEGVLAQAKMDLERYQAAWARNAVSKQILDDQEKLVRQDEGTVKNDQGIVQFDKLQVEYCHIISPITGRVGLRLVDPGNLVTAGASGNANPLAVIAQIQPITVIFTIPQDSLGPVQAQLRKNSKLSVDVFDSWAKTKIATGELLALDNQIDTTTGTVKVRSVFKNDDFALFPNQFVNTRLLVETLEGVTLIPTATIQQNGQTSFVYVIEDSVAHLRTVKVGVTDNGLTQVEGINPGDVIANSSFDKLQDNSKIILASEAPSSAHKGAGKGGKGGQDVKGP
jgi:multidrug efflux system membrane fusion protein